jgi:ATP-binding cassette subfamily B multidrug efflux pump
MRTLMKNKTVIAVAHRLSTLREMDRIIVMENGKIVEEGTHLNLLRKKGRYAKLFKMQSDGYIQSI